MITGLVKGQKKEFGIYHWDTFDNTTFRVAERTTLQKAIDYIFDHYSISGSGADRIDIVNKKGSVLRSYSITGSK